jgi:hypothetical protein
MGDDTLGAIGGGMAIALFAGEAEGADGDHTGWQCDDVVVRLDVTVRSDVPIQGWPYSHPDWGDGLELFARHDGGMDK